MNGAQALALVCEHFTGPRDPHTAPINELRAEIEAVHRVISPHLGHNLIADLALAPFTEVAATKRGDGARGLRTRLQAALICASHAHTTTQENQS